MHSVRRRGAGPEFRVADLASGQRDPAAKAGAADREHQRCHGERSGRTRPAIRQQERDRSEGRQRVENGSGPVGSIHVLIEPRGAVVISQTADLFVGAVSG